MRPSVAIAVVCALLISGCLLSSNEDAAPALAGTWGGNHISIRFQTGPEPPAVLASIEYDCAFGTIESMSGPDRAGVFVGFGTHFFSHGGPLREDEQLDPHPARYDGLVRGTSMTLTVTLTDTGIELGTFTAEYDVVGSVFKCL